VNLIVKNMPFIVFDSIPFPQLGATLLVAASMAVHDQTFKVETFKGELIE
jgi:hypothetical protein